MRLLLLFIFLFSIESCYTQETHYSSSLSYPESIFNSDTCCWRKLSSAEQYDEAAKLILSYYRQNKKVANQQALYWHAGQCFAMAGENEMAKKYMQKTYSSFYKWFGGEDGSTWYYYARGTIAFLDRDKRKLSAMIEKWDGKFPQDINYQALLELSEKWDLPYKDINRKVNN